jgi:putative secretion ATPase (PEP-CTERM system associated)
MYEHFFNLTAEPFRLSPDHRFCYSHTQYFKAKAYMAYAFLRAEGFVMITGRPGTGKTTLIGDLVESLADENVAVANLVSTQLAADDLLRMVAFAFDLPAQGVEKSTVLQQLTTRFLSLYREGGRALLIVDEAQDLTPKAMEELRLLTNLQQDGNPLVQIFLLGQTELRDLVHDQGLEQVHQRIIATSHLEPLKDNETREYVEHRLRVVDWRNDPAISTAVYPIIHLFSEGVPRRINLICSRLFLQCCVEQRHHITVADARSVVQELQEEQLSTRNLLSDEVFFAPDVFEEPILEQQAQGEPVLSRSGGEQSRVEQAGAAQVEVELPREIQTPESPQDDCEPGESEATAMEIETRPELELDPPPDHQHLGGLVESEMADPGGELVFENSTEQSTSAITRLGLLAVLLATGLVALLLLDQGFYVTLVTELERIWCLLSFTC